MSGFQSDVELCWRRMPAVVAPSSIIRYPAEMELLSHEPAAMSRYPRRPSISLTERQPVAAIGRAAGMKEAGTPLSS